MIGNSYVGGFCGSFNGSSLQNCFQLGISSDPTSRIVIANSKYVGGLGGYCKNCNISKSGVEQGKIYASSVSASFIGGAIGYLEAPGVTICEVYTSSLLLIDVGGNSATLVGGLFGNFVIDSSGTNKIENCYSSSSISSPSGTSIGGLFGQIVASKSNPITNISFCKFLYTFFFKNIL